MRHSRLISAFSFHVMIKNPPWFHNQHFGGFFLKRAAQDLRRRWRQGPLTLRIWKKTWREFWDLICTKYTRVHNTRAGGETLCTTMICQSSSLKCVDFRVQQPICMHFTIPFSTYTRVMAAQVINHESQKNCLSCLIRYSFGMKKETFWLQLRCCLWCLQTPMKLASIPSKKV